MGKAAEVVHGREHSVPAADGTHTKLLQVPHGQAGHESLRTEENQPHQSLRLQVHQRARKVDKDCKAISTEYLKFPTPTEVAVVGIDSFFFFNFLFSLRSRKLLL